MSKIPKIIWTFWNSKTLTPVIDNCIKTWRFLNPDYEIKIIDEEGAKMYVPNLKNFKHNDSYARLSDLVRLNALSKYGGIWLDASTICTESFDRYFSHVEKKKKTDVEFVGFYSQQFTTRKKYPVIESWAFMCEKDSPFVKAWRDEFMSMNKYKEVDAYLEHTQNRLKVDFQNIGKYDDPNYLAIHIAAQKVLQYDKYNQKNMYVSPAEDGPLKYRLYRKGSLSVQKRVERLCRDPKIWFGNPIIKFTGGDREIMDKKRKIRECVFNNYKIRIMTEISGIK